MKTGKLIIALSLVISSFLVACGPSTVAVRTRPAGPVYVRQAAPRSGYIWVGENYIWRGGRYVYQPGYWAAPQRGRTYVPGYWSKSRRGDVWVQGRWR